MQNPAVFFYQGLRVPVNVIAGAPLYNVQSMLVQLTARGKSIDVSKTARRRLGSLLDRLSETGRDWQEFGPDSEVHVTPAVLYSLLRERCIRGFGELGAGASEGDCADKLVPHMESAYCSLLCTPAQQDMELDAGGGTPAMTPGVFRPGRSPFPPPGHRPGIGQGPEHLVPRVIANVQDS